eukprot:6694340-Pyramimonas_sp.AAC.1
MHHASVFMLEVNPAGVPADGSDGSWMQAQGADVSGISSSGAAPDDVLHANGPRRTQAQQPPTPAGQPAGFPPRVGPQLRLAFHRVL